jgi:hypothetical protein
MESVVEGSAKLPQDVKHRPSADLNYSFYPASSILERVRANLLPLFDKSGERIFIEKWPGLITAFDELLKAPSFEEVRTRLSGLYETAQRAGLTEKRLYAAIERWGEEHGISARNLERLGQLAVQIRQKQLTFQFHGSATKRGTKSTSPPYAK